MKTFYFFWSLIIAVFLSDQNQSFDVYESSFRFCDPCSGRFVSPDPVAPTIEKHGLDRYGYVYNNPINLTDLSGNTPEEPFGISEMTLVSAEPQQVSALTVRQDFDASGNLISQTQAAQIAAFGAREVLKTSFTIDAVVTTPKVIADGIVLNHPDILEPSLSLRIIDLPETERAAARRVQMNAYWQVDSYRHPDRISARPHRVLQPVLYPEADYFRKPTTYRRSYIRYPLGGLGFDAGLSQTPIAIRPGMLLYEEIREVYSNFKVAATIPAALGGLGGVASILGYMNETNPVFKTAGLTSGGIEILGGASYYTGAWAAGSHTASGVKLMQWGSRLMRFGGGLGLGITAALFFYEMHQEGAWEDPTVDPTVVRKDYEDSGHQVEPIRDAVGNPVEPCKGNFCLAEGTQVWTVNGLKRVEEVAIGESVWAPAQQGSSILSQAKVVLVSENEVGRWLQIKTNQGFLNLTKNHPVKIQDFGWKLAGEIELGDCLVSFKSNQLTEDLRVLNVQEVESPVKVYNFHVTANNEFYVSASGVLVKGLQIDWIGKVSP